MREFMDRTYKILIVIWAVAVYLLIMLVAAYIVAPSSGDDGILIEVLVVFNAKWRELAIFVVGLFLITIAVMLRLRGKEEYTHKHDTSRLSLTLMLPEDDREARSLLRSVVLRHIKTKHGLSEEEFDGLSDPDIKTMIEDDGVAELVLDEERTYTRAELDVLAKKIRAMAE